MLQLEKHEIQIYDFPADELEPEQHWMRDRLPFAVVGSNTVVTDEEGIMVRGREYPWGTVNIEDKVGKLCSYINCPIEVEKVGSLATGWTDSKTLYRKLIFPTNLQHINQEPDIC